MSERQLHLLSASRMPTSYPLQIAADEVAAWLNGYAALWHPAALAGAGQVPRASVSYDHDSPTTNFVYCTPRGPHLFQPDDWKFRVETVGAFVFEGTADRAETVGNLLAALRERGETNVLFDAAPDVVRTFLGLGYGYLVLDNLFEAADHERLLDAGAFWSDVCAAVDAAKEGKPEYRDHLKAAAEKLQTARDQLHSQKMHWLDFVQLDGGTLAAWPQSLASGLPLSVFGSGEAFERLAEQSPERFAELKAKFLPDLPAAVDLCCGAYREREDALMPAESQWWNMGAGRAALHRLFGASATVYARKTSAFHPQLPGWLHHMGFKHAVLVSRDGAMIPTIRSTAVNWPGPDGRSIDAFSREPLPAHDPLTFFNLVYHMYQATTTDSAPTVALVHKGEPAFDSYGDLLALAELGPVFGEFTNLSRYFTDATSGDYIGVQQADEFFNDYLDDRVTNQKRPEPVSGFAHHLRLRRSLDSAYTLAALHRSVTPNPGEEELLGELRALETEVETVGANASASGGRFSASPAAPTTNSGPTPAARLGSVESAWAKKLAARLQTRSADGQPGLLVFNPCGFTRRVALEVTGFRGMIPVADPVKAAEFNGDVARLVVEVPPLGFAWVPRAGNASAPRQRLKLADGLTVRNEFFECDVDSGTGGIRSFRDLRTRHTRFAQQLVYNPGSKMIVRDIQVTNSGTALGEITSSGDIINDRDEVLASFRQRYRAWLGRPVLEVRIELDVKHEPTGYPWHSFYAARFGWRDDRSVLFRGVNGANTQTGVTRPVSPDYLEVRLAAERSFLFTGGLPFIQRHGNRMADVILVPEGEQARSFDLLLATDRDVPMQTAVGWVSPTPVVETEKGPPHFGTSGWLAHVDMPSLIVTGMQPCPASEGSNRAIAMRLMETAGFGGAAELRFARDPSRGALIDGEGKSLQPLNMTGEAVQLEYSAGETLRVKLDWE